VLRTLGDMPTLFAPAKLNVTLEVLARRDDGYHTLRSLMLPVALYDRIDLVLDGPPRFRASDPALHDGNLILRALEAAGFGGRFDVTLDKRIPVGGGLGGGSSDAAAILRAAMNGDFGEAQPRDWVAAASGLGSDVPFFLAGTGALVEGTGERVTPVGALPDWWAVVVRPRVSVPTAAAYRLLDEARAARGGPPSRPRGTSASLEAVDALQRRDFAALEAALTNDFHDIIFDAYPEVARAGRALAAATLAEANADATRRRVLLSGSGSCLFALFEREAQARGTAAILEGAGSGDIDAVFAVPFHHDSAWR
jgi:4-diphosphocytidyl-2-C-methyl-D-erythritol kinase